MIRSVLFLSLIAVLVSCSAMRQDITSLTVKKMGEYGEPHDRPVEVLFLHPEPKSRTIIARYSDFDRPGDGRFRVLTSNPKRYDHSVLPTAQAIGADAVVVSANERANPMTGFPTGEYNLSYSFIRWNEDYPADKRLTDVSTIRRVHEQNVR